MNRDIYFSIDTQSAFKDYMFDYCANQLKREGFAYDATVSFAEKEKIVNAAIISDIQRVAGTSLEVSGITPEVMANHPSIRFATFAVVGQLIDTILPDVIDPSISAYTDTVFGNFGDSFRFDVEPKDLFAVYKAGRNQRTVETQTGYSTTQYIVPVNHEISVECNLYKTLCGQAQMAKFVIKAILSVEANITKELYALVGGAMDNLPSTADSGLQISASSGVVSKQDALALVEKVKAFNGGAPALFVGTKVALSRLNPNSTDGFRYTNPSLAYFRNIWSVDTLELPQVADWADKYKLVLNDKKVWIISPSSQKLAKLCYEGATMTNILTAQQTANKTEITTMEKSYGMGIVTNAIAAQINF